jgi:hypothetical protein
MHRQSVLPTILLLPVRAPSHWPSRVAHFKFFRIVAHGIPPDSGGCRDNDCIQSRLEVGARSLDQSVGRVTESFWESSEGFDEHWRKTKEAISSVIKNLMEYGVLSSDLLPSWNAPSFRRISILQRPSMGFWLPPGMGGTAARRPPLSITTQSRSGGRSPSTRPCTTFLRGRWSKTRAVLNEKANRSFSAKPPDKYLNEHNVKPERLAEQAVPAVESLEVDKFEEFLKIRAEELGGQRQSP